LLERLQECCISGLCLRIVRRQIRERADASHAIALLRARRERPRERCASERG
jgi:hypothetical protein